MIVRKTRLLRTAATGAAIAAVVGLLSVARAADNPDAARAAEVIAKRQALLAGLSPVTDEMLQNPPPGDWLQWRRTYDLHGFSPLTQINKSNVAGLRSTWSWALPEGTGEITPLVHDGVMFVYGNRDKIQALDAATGDFLWEYSYQMPPGPAWPGIAGTYRKSFALYDNMLIFPTFDSHEIALDVKTGKEIWRQKITDIKLPYRASSGPLPVKGKLIQGFTNCSRLQPGGCFILGMDAKTGKELWRIYTLARPGEPGDETWNGAPLEERQGAGVWTTGSYDPQTGLAYFGTGNTYAWQYLVRGDARQNAKKDGRYINSTLAVNPETGKMQWFYQHLPQDMWNQDWAFEQIIATLPVNGKPQKTVLSTGKMAVTDLMDAATGKWIASIDQGQQTFVKSIDQKTGRKIFAEEAIPDMARKRRNLVCGGGKNWPASSYDAATNMLYIIVNAGTCSAQMPDEYGPDNPYRGGDMSDSEGQPNPQSDGNQGRIDAVNLVTKKTVWSVRQRSAIASAALSTAGGLLFVGDADRWFKALDPATGDVLWQTRLSHTVNNFPITYSVNGKQYVAVAAGQGLSGDSRVTPDVKTPTNRGAALWVFELPNAR